MIFSYCPPRQGMFEPLPGSGIPPVHGWVEFRGDGHETVKRDAELQTERGKRDGPPARQPEIGQQKTKQVQEKIDRKREVRRVDNGGKHPVLNETADHVHRSPQRRIDGGGIGNIGVQGLPAKDEEQNQKIGNPRDQKIPEQRKILEQNDENQTGQQQEQDLVVGQPQAEQEGGDIQKLVRGAAHPNVHEQHHHHQEEGVQGIHFDDDGLRPHDWTEGEEETSDDAAGPGNPLLRPRPEPFGALFNGMKHVSSGTRDQHGR